MSILRGILEDDDITRLRMGRFSDADEREMNRLMRGHGRDFVMRALGIGMDPRVPAVATSRPPMRGRGQTFVFAHSIVRKEGVYRPPPARVLFVAPKAVAYATGARYDGRAAGSWGRGAWYVPPARIAAGAAPLPSGGKAVYAAPRVVGLTAGTARAFQLYMERDGAVETMPDGTRLSAGRLSIDALERSRFWDDVERVEREDGRVQFRIIAEVPYEPAVGTHGRGEILDRFGSIFDRLDLPWHGVVHVPPPEGDVRNFHIHLAYHDRPIVDRAQDGFTLARRKERRAHAMDFLPQLRSAYAEIVNDVLERAGVERRFDPSRYDDADVAKPPTVHLGSAASAKEREGVVTSAGSRQAELEMGWRMERLLDRLAIDAGHDEQRLRAAAAAAAVPQLEGLAGVALCRAVQRLGTSCERLAAASSASVRAAAAKTVAQWRAEDMTLRLRRAARRCPDGLVAAGAALMVAEIDGRLRPRTRQAAATEAAARAAHGSARRGLDQAMRLLHAETAIARLVKARDAHDRWRPADARLLPEEWEARGAALAATARRLEGLVTADRVPLEGLARRLYGSHGPELVAKVLDPLSRAKAIAVLRGDLGDRGADDGGARHRLLGALESLAAAAARAGRARGAVREHERVSSHPAALVRFVLSEPEAGDRRRLKRRLLDALAGAEAGVRALPLALRLARARGLLEAPTPSRVRRRGSGRERS